MDPRNTRNHLYPPNPPPQYRSMAPQQSWERSRPSYAYQPNSHGPVHMGGRFYNEPFPPSTPVYTLGYRSHAVGPSPPLRLERRVSQPYLPYGQPLASVPFQEPFRDIGSAAPVPMFGAPPPLASSSEMYAVQSRAREAESELRDSKQRINYLTVEKEQSLKQQQSFQEAVMLEWQQLVDKTDREKQALKSSLAKMNRDMNSLFQKAKSWQKIAQNRRVDPAEVGAPKPAAATTVFQGVGGLEPNQKISCPSGQQLTISPGVSSPFHEPEEFTPPAEKQAAPAIDLTGDSDDEPTGVSGDEPKLSPFAASNPLLAQPPTQGQGRKGVPTTKKTQKRYPWMGTHDPMRSPKLHSLRQGQSGEQFETQFGALLSTADGMKSVDEFNRTNKASNRKLQQAANFKVRKAKLADNCAAKKRPRVTAKAAAAAKKRASDEGLEQAAEEPVNGMAEQIAGPANGQKSCKRQKRKQASDAGLEQLAEEPVNGMAEQTAGPANGQKSCKRQKGKRAPTEVATLSQPKAVTPTKETGPQIVFNHINFNNQPGTAEYPPFDFSLTNQPDTPEYPPFDFTFTNQPVEDRRASPWVTSPREEAAVIVPALEDMSMSSLSDQPSTPDFDALFGEDLDAPLFAEPILQKEGARLVLDEEELDMAAAMEADMDTGPDDLWV